MKKKQHYALIIPLLGIAAAAASHLFRFAPGITLSRNFLTYAGEILPLIPPLFILIGLFEVWVKRETVERHLGAGAGWSGHFWALLLGSTTIGPMIMALPVAASLAGKGARLSVVFTYLGAAAVCRIPMTLFEISCLGPLFTFVRYIVSLPLIILTSSLLGRFLEKRGYALKSEKE